MKKRGQAVLFIFIAIALSLGTLLVLSFIYVAPQTSPADALTFKNSAGEVIATFSENAGKGEISLAGACIDTTDCSNPPADSYEINNSGEIVSYIDESGNLCIKSGTCLGSDRQNSCSSANSALAVKSDAGTTLISISNAGSLCLTGSLHVESDTPGCAPNWEKQTTECFGGQQVIYYNDSNLCGTTTGQPANETILTCDFCIEKWRCTPWSPQACTAGNSQTRSCTDSNLCDRDENRPANQTRPILDYECSVDETDLCEDISNLAIQRIEELQASGISTILREGEDIPLNSRFAIPDETGGLYRLTALTNNPGSYNGDKVTLENRLSNPVTSLTNFASREGYIPFRTLGPDYAVEYSGSSSITIDFPITPEGTIGTFNQCVAECISDVTNCAPWSATGETCTTTEGEAGHKESQTCIDKKTNPICDPPKTTTRCVKVPDCAVWIKDETACTSNDEFIEYYIDNSPADCGAGAPPINKTFDCDYQGLGLIGTENEITKTNIDLKVFIGGSRASTTTDYSGTKSVEIKDDNDTLVEFEHDFSSPLKLRGILIKKNSQVTNFGYVIINGISEEKMVRVERVKSGSDSVCVKKSEITSITKIKNSCSRADEVEIDCPGEEDDIDCTIESGFFVVGPLANSAVKELGGTSTGTCTPDWDCGAGFGTCINNQRAQTCEDVNECGTTSGRPPTSESCTSTPENTCTPNWDCDSYPSECPSSGTKTRSCTDLNSCGTPTKQETRRCTESDKTNILLIVGLVVGVFLVIGVIILVMALRGKRKRQEFAMRRPAAPRSIITGQQPGQRKTF